MKFLKNDHQNPKSLVKPLNTEYANEKNKGNLYKFLDHYIPTAISNIVL